jgi:hypothetical protein
MLISLPFVEYSWNEFIFMMGLGFLVSGPIVIPSLILYFSYMAKGVKGDIYGDGIHVYFKKENEYMVEKLTLVQRNLNKNIDDIHSLLPWDSYYYLFVETKEGESFYLTCLTHRKKAFFKLNGRVCFEVQSTKWPSISSHLNVSQKKSLNVDDKMPNSKLDKELW